MDELIMVVVEKLLIILVTIAAGYTVAYLRKRLGVEGMQRIELELALKQELAVIAVRFVEQAFRDFKGDEKYNLAADWIADRATEKGIKVTADEIKGLIEAALRAFKDEFGEQWAKE
jgi:LL-H family phage holin